MHKVIITFPVVGHSFLPPDWVFGRIETKVRGINVILSPMEYEVVLKEFGTVIKLGTNLPVFDWKSATKVTAKPPVSWHLQLKPCKRLILERKSATGATVQGEQAYNIDVGVGRLTQSP